MICSQKNKKRSESGIIFASVEQDYMYTVVNVYTVRTLSIS